MRLDLLYDIALFINKYNENINWQYIISFVKKIEAYDEFSIIISLLKKYVRYFIQSNEAKY